MIAGAKNSKLYTEWLDYIGDDDAKDAFRYMIGVAAALKSYICHPQVKGVVRDFRFIDRRNEQPFAFIVNQSSLLFYFRLPAVRSGEFSFEVLQAVFPSAAINRKGEWKVRIERIDDVQRLFQLMRAQ